MIASPRPAPSYLTSSPPPIAPFPSPFLASPHRRAPNPWSQKTSRSLDSRQPTLRVPGASKPNTRSLAQRHNRGHGDSRIENNHASLDHMLQGCQGMDVTLLIDRILPGVLIFDGLLDSASSIASPLPTTRTSKSMKSTPKDDYVPPAPPTPSLLSQHAFAHVRPDSWLTALSSPTAPRRGE